MNEKIMNEKVMSEKISEQISALVDGELDSDEQEFLLRRLAKDEGLQGKWHRYNLISDALQNHLPELVDTGLTKKINNVLEKEGSLHGSNLLSNSSGVAKKLVKSVAGLSIAASVAVFSIVGIQQYNSLQVNDSLQVQNDVGSVNLASNAALLPAISNTTNVANRETLAAVRQPVLQNGVSPVYIRVSGTRWDHDQPKVGSRLNGYLVNHNEYTSATNLQGLVNYSRIAGYDIKK